MDNAMLFTFGIVIALTIFLIVVSYILYDNCMKDYIYGDFDSISSESSFIPLVSEKGEILIDGKPFIIDKTADNYTLIDFTKLGASVLNREILNLREAT